MAITTHRSNILAGRKDSVEGSSYAFRGSNFLNTADLPQEAFVELVERALRLKQEGFGRKLLLDQVVGMVFFNPSLRTKTSLASGVARLGGTAIDLAVGQNTYAFEYEEGAVMDGPTQEHIKEAAPVLSQYCDAIGVRSSELVTSGSKAADSSATWAEARKDQVVRSFARYSTVPVINLESNVYHPCQGLGDALTLREHFGKQSGKRRVKYVLTWPTTPSPYPPRRPIRRCSPRATWAAMLPWPSRKGGTLMKRSRQ